MTVPTNITEPPMGHTEQESHLESKRKETSYFTGPHPTCLQDSYGTLR